MRWPVIILFSVLTGCNAQRKATRFMEAHPEVNAPICAKQFPVKEVDIVLPGDAVISVDSNYYISADIVDTVQERIAGARKVVTRTVMVRDTILRYRENTAQVESLALDLQRKEIQLWEAEEKLMVATEKLAGCRQSLSKAKFRLWIWGVGLLGVLILILYLRERARRDSKK